MKSNVLRALSLFILVTILIQVFYSVMASFNLWGDGNYFPKGYAIHILYYLSILFVTFLFIGKIDFAAVGLKSVASWKNYLLIGLLFAFFHLGIRTVVAQGTFNRSYTLPLELYIPAYVFIGLLIGLAEESAFRGYVLKNFLEDHKPIFAILLSSLLFGIYHINYLDLNFYSMSWWAFYAAQSFTAGSFMGLLYYKTGGNLIGPITYHSSHIIIGQIMPWMPLIEAQHLLAISTTINVIQAIILMYLPIDARGGK